MDASGVISTVVVAIAGLLATWFTRRSAKEQTAVSGFTALTAAQSTELERLFTRVDTLESRDVALRRANREHGRWDATVVTELQRAGITVPDPPPLDL